MWEVLKTIGSWVIWLVSLAGAVGAIYKWVASPLKDIRTSIAVVADDVGDIFCDRLNQAHDYWVGKGYCPKADKTRLVEMHQRYTAMGRNHLTANYENDLIRLPEHPPDRR